MAPNWPSVDVVKYFDDSRERLREAFEQATGRFEHVRSAARDTSEVLQDCHTATIAGLKEINEHALEGVQSDMDRLFDYGRQLAEVKSVPEALEAHGTFVRQSFETGLERVRAMSEMSANLFKSAFEPFQSGMSNVIEQAKKRAE
jgi:phasin family protein